ncbi:MAG: TRAP transporter substrate-binding protein [Myxococcales bacterium]|nr:TRAP transporter substrate-binding protein [Myxococcales bacterium]
MADPSRPPVRARRRFLAGSAAVAASTLLLGRRRAYAGDAEITLKLAVVAPPGTPWARHIRWLTTRVMDGTGGRVVIKPHLGGALGDEVSTLSRCRQGGVEMWAGSVVACASAVPEIAALELPYLFPTLAAADDILDNRVTGEIESMMTKAGLKLLFFSENGYRSIGTNFGFVHAVADLKGKRVRAQPGDVPTHTWRAMGASPLSIPETEALTALQTGVVDGFANTPLFAYAASWLQAATHVTLTRHSYQPALVVMNLDTWQALPKTAQALIRGDPKQQARLGRKIVRGVNKQVLDVIPAIGVELHESTSSELAAFKAACEPTHKQFTDKHGDSFYKAITKHL